MKRIVLVSLTAAFLVGCQDTRFPTGAEPGSPAILLSDGRDALGGNPDFFWFPPMLPDPSGETFFEAGQFDSGLLSQSRVRICAQELDGAGNPVLDVFGDPVFNLDGTCAAAAVAEFTSTVGFDGQFLRLEAMEELYMANWHTDMSGLSDGLTYRIFALISDNVAGFADVDVVNSGKELKSVETDEFIALKDGRTLPIKYRLEAGIRCLGVTGSCGAGKVGIDVGGRVSVGADDPSVAGSTTAGVDVGASGTDEDVVFVVKSCLVVTGSANLGTDLPPFGPCIDVTAFIGDVQIFELPVDPLTGVPQPTTIFACLEDADVTGFATLKPGQEEVLRMHRQDGAAVEALPLADDPCALIPVLASSPSNGIVRFARAVLDGVVGFIGPKTLHARRRRIDLLSGGVTGPFSQFQLLLPSKMEILEGDGQTTLVGTQVPIAPAVLVTDARDNPVEGARVTFDVTAGGGFVASTQVIVFSDVNGESRVASWTIGAVAGTDNNTLEASCFGCATAGEVTDGPQPIFDPFTPLPLTASPVGPVAGEADIGPAVELLVGNLAFTASGRDMSVAGIGGNFGNTVADDIFSSGDLAGSITRLTESQFNAKTDAQLADEFDVLMITWNSDASLDVDWASVLSPYLNSGGGVIFDGDPNNIGDLAAVVTTSFLTVGGESAAGITVSATVPGLTDGIGSFFANNHIRFATFSTFDPVFSSFLTLTIDAVDHVVGLHGPVGTGCIVLTGPDQDFHGFRIDGGGNNQYELLINELEFVTDPTLCN